ncbi:MAG TPA: lipocalin-like domain-containing protein [Stellaceae bacterium]|jgi:hypothetical protein|nr:lipocalin-like domain-containing protein [Stellaceae bacterium]
MRPLARRIAAISLALGVVSGSAAADDTSVQQLTGVWLLSSDRDKEVAVGDSAKGTMTLEGGNFAVQIISPDLPKIAAEDRSLGTADENAAIAQQSLAYFGAYELDEATHSLVLHIYYSSFANWRDTDQKWTVSLNADRMTWTRPGNTAPALVWQRAPSGAAVATRGRHY